MGIVERPLGSDLPRAFCGAVRIRFGIITPRSLTGWVRAGCGGSAAVVVFQAGKTIGLTGEVGWSGAGAVTP